MSIDRDNEELESYLRQFHAQAPGPLPDTGAFRLRRASAMLAAIGAVLIGVFAVAMWHVDRPKPLAHPTRAHHSVDDISMVRLGRVAQGDSQELDSSLTGLSKELLPDTRTSQGVLRELSDQ